MTDTLRSTVKEKLTVGEVVSSMTVRLVPSVEIVQVIKSAGFDSFYIDLEHSPLTIETTNQIATTALAAGIDCFARVPANTPDYISRVLDGVAWASLHLVWRRRRKRKPSLTRRSTRPPGRAASRARCR